MRRDIPFFDYSDEEVAERLLTLRENKSIADNKRFSQDSLSEEIGICTKAYRKYESGEPDGTSCKRRYTRPGIEVLCRLADYYDKSIDYLVGRDKDYSHIGNKEIAEITGLSDKSIEVLRRINERTSDSTGHYGPATDNYSSRAIDMLNLILEESYDWAVDNPQDPIDSVLCDIYDAINIKDAKCVKSEYPFNEELQTVSFFDDNAGIGRQVIPSELYQTYILSRITDWIKQAHEVKDNRRDRIEREVPFLPSI